MHDSLGSREGTVSKPVTSRVLSSNPACGEYLHGQSPSLHARGILSQGSHFHTAERQREGLASLHFSLMSSLFLVLFSTGSMVFRASVYLINQN